MASSAAANYGTKTFYCCVFPSNVFYHDDCFSILNLFAAISTIVLRIGSFDCADNLFVRYMPTHMAGTELGDLKIDYG